MGFLEQETLVPALAALQSPSLGVQPAGSRGVLGCRGFVAVLFRSRYAGAFVTLYSLQCAKEGR